MLIQDLDSTIRQLLIQDALIDTTIAEIKFERPDSEWENGLSSSKPTVNCFLHDIRENLDLRFDQQTYVARNMDKTEGTVTIAPARIDFKYLITVWASMTANEHQLLGQILAALIKLPIIPTTRLQGTLTSQTLPVRAWVAQPEDMPQVWEFWGANEWRLKASLSYRVTLAVERRAAEMFDPLVS